MQLWPGSSAIPTTVGNGQIVLLRTGAGSYGAFVPRNQLISPDRMEFDWYCRKDGKGTFKRSESVRYKSGSGAGVPDSSVPYLMARFGSFSLGWSACEIGKGHIYYPHFKGETVSPSDMRICVTRETDIRKINATDAKWVYKGSPDDPTTVPQGCAN